MITAISSVVITLRFVDLSYHFFEVSVLFVMTEKSKKLTDQERRQMKLILKQELIAALL